MLVLTRKQNERIRIGDSIVITVLRMKGKAVRLGIEAPSDINVLRGELAFESSAGDPEKVIGEPSQPRAPSSRREAADRWPADNGECPRATDTIHAASASRPGK